MDLLNWILTILVLILSLPCGYLLGWIAKEEMKSLEKILFFVFRIFLVVFGMGLVLYFYYATTFVLFIILASIFALGFLRGSFYFLPEQKK